MPRPGRRGHPKGAASRTFSLWASGLFLALASLFITVDAHAYPWMIRHNYTNCSGCHADPSGGELLTLYGHAISYEVLSTRWGGSEPSSAEAAKPDAESDAAVRRRIARATAQAARAKSAPPSKDADADEESTDENEESTDDAETDLDAAEGEGEESAEDADSGSEAEKPAEEASAAAPEPSPFEGMSGLTGPLFGLLPPRENFLFGGSIRLATLYSFPEKNSDEGTAANEEDDDALRFFPMQLDLYGQVRIGSAFRVAGGLGVLKVPAGSPHGRAAQLTVNQDDGYNLVSRTHWVGFDFGGGAHTIRAGRLNLPFGIRMSEHTMWVRDKTQTDRESDQQHGVALYMSFDSVRFEVMAILGNYQINADLFRERGYSGYIEFATSPQFVFGASSLYTSAGDDRFEPAGFKTIRHTHGPFVRWAPAEVVSIMAEADVLFRSRRDSGYVGYLQVDVEPMQGLHLIGTGELLDGGYPDRQRQQGDARTAGLGRPLPGGWLSLQWFFLPHFDVRVDAIIRQDKAILSQLHVYL